MADDDALKAVERLVRPRGIPVSGVSFSVYVLTDASYRNEFLDHVPAELRQAFAVRAVHLASRTGSGG